MSLSLGAGLLLASGAQSAASGLINYGMQKDAQAFNAAEAEKARSWEAQQAALTREFNSAEAQKTRDWNEYMSSSAYQRSVADMKAAGINPASLGGNGTASPASFGSSASASAGMPSPRSATSAMAHATVSGISDALYQAARIQTMKQLGTSSKKSGFLQDFETVSRETGETLEEMRETMRIANIPWTHLKGGF